MLATNNLGANMPSGTLSLPTVTGGTLTTLYPFVVNGTSVLWDNSGSDNVRKIIGLSPAGGIALFSGNDNTTGSGIQLNSYGATTNPGAVQTISNGPGTLGTLAFQHSNYNTSSSSLQSIFSLDQMGNMNVMGGVSFPMLGGDLGMRQIQGQSTNYGIDMVTGSFGSAHGSEMMLTGPGYSTPSLVYFNADGPSSVTGLAYDLRLTTGTIHAFQINNNGHARIGNNGAPTATDVLTVDGNLYLNSETSDPTVDRNIFCRTTQASLNVTSSSVVDGSGGACFTAVGSNNSTDTYQPWGLAFPGAFFVRSCAQAMDAQTTISYALQNYEDGRVAGTGVLHNIFLVDALGRGIYGHDCDIPLIVGDVFTLKQSLGFWYSDDVTPRTISGHTGGGVLDIAASNGYSNGSDISLFGQGNSTNPGQIRYSSYGTTGLGHGFISYDGVNSHNNFLIGNNGLSVIGPDVSLSYITGGDALTVEGFMGLYSVVDDEFTRGIHGNSTTGGLCIYSNNTSTNGSGIELWASSSPDWPGQIHYISNGASGYGQIMGNYGSGYHYTLGVTNDQRVAIGQSVVNDGSSTALLQPGDVLTIQDQLGMYSSTGGFVNINGNSTNQCLALHGLTGSTNGGTIEIYGPSASGKQGCIDYISDGAGYPNNVGHNFYAWNGSTSVSLMRVYNNGAVVVGDPSLTMPGAGTNYLMYVQHGILSEHVRVASHTTGAWADYVFKKNYNLMPLSSVERYVKTNSRLPGMPSADEVQKDGIDVESMDSKLLQKIEELTLYVIQQNKRIDELEKKLADKQ